MCCCDHPECRCLRDLSPLAHLIRELYFSPDPATGHPGCCIFPAWHQGFLCLGVTVWKIDCKAQPSRRFVKLSPFLSCGQRLAQAVPERSVNFPCCYRLASLGAFNISSSLHLPSVNLPKMSFQRTKLQRSEGEEKLLFRIYCFAKVSV